MKKIYLDHAATTPVDPKVLGALVSSLKKTFGNVSSLHSIGREAYVALREARSEVARILGTEAKEIIFTGSGTESDNLALFGVANAYNGKHIIVSKIEHPAVLEAAKKLERQGFEITYLNIDSEGLVNTDELKNSLRKDTVLVSIMYANNEIGTIQPIKEISGIIQKFRGSSPFPLFHTDACQAAGALELDVKKLGVDLMTLNGSKIYGPKGVGCLYVAKHVRLEPMLVGGGQENGLRAGTENVALISAFAEALKLAEKTRKNESKRLKTLRDYFIKNIFKKIKNIRLNGHSTKRLPNNINISVHQVEGESLVLMLDKFGICASTGSACSSRSLTPSHVLLALGLSPEIAHGSLRLTLGRTTTKRDVDSVLKILPDVVEKLRKISAIRP